MKITGIICEYNPFHNGHLYQINEVKKSSDYIIAVMSGNWIQRGGPSIIDKYSRTEMALKSGVDLVIELPVAYSAGSARDFAFGGVSLLDSLGCVDELSFGCESPQSDSFELVSNFMIEHIEDIEKEFALEMKKGVSYPKARENILLKYFDAHIVEGLSKPNNILAMEYHTALKRLKSNININPIKREGSDYSDTSLNLQSYSCATAIRNTIIDSYNFIMNDDSCYNSPQNESSPSTYISFTGESVRQAMSEPLSPLRNHVPGTTYEILLERFGKGYPLTYNNFSREIGYKLILEAADGYEDYLDVSRELSDKIIKNLSYFQSVDQFCNILKTKEITYARISRCLTHILLDIKKDTFPRETRPGYARILGFRKDSEPLLSVIKSNSSIPMISKLADAPKILNQKDLAMLGKDIQASHIYNLVSACKYQNELKNEFTQKIIIV